MPLKFCPRNFLEELTTLRESNETVSTVFERAVEMLEEAADAGYRPGDDAFAFITHVSILHSDFLGAGRESLEDMLAMSEEEYQARRTMSARFSQAFNQIVPGK